MMKYAINHPWKFRDYKLAFGTGLLQWMISCTIELTNVYILLSNSSTQFDVIANFIIMLVVAEFDSYFEAIRSVDPRSELIQNERYASILYWETTTSWDAVAETPDHELRQEKVLLKSEMHQRPKYIYIKFSARSCFNMFLFVIYRLL